MKVGDVIRVIRMDDSNGKDPAVHKMNDVISVITHIDDMGQIHIYGYGLAIIPGVDEFEILETRP